jgi:AraC-like DNA-binding protein
MEFTSEIVGHHYFYHHSRTRHPGMDSFYLHTHDAFEVYNFLRGDAMINIEDKYFRLAAGDLFIIRPGRFHRVILESDVDYERRVLRFDHVFLRSIDPEDLLTSSLPEPVFLRGEGSPTEELVTTIFQRVAQTAGMESRLQEIALKAIVTELLIHVSTGAVAPDAPDSLYPGGAKISAMIDFINANLDGDLSLDRLSGQFYTSKFYLSRVFKENTGSTIGDFVLKKRLILAKRLILGGTTPLNACFQSGFTDYSSFFKGYKKYFGTSPSGTRRGRPDPPGTAQ